MTPTATTPAVPDDRIILHKDRVERGTRNLLTLSEPPCLPGWLPPMLNGVAHVAPPRVGLAFGVYNAKARMPGNARAYHWGERSSTGRLTLLTGPDPREVLTP